MACLLLDSRISMRPTAWTREARAMRILKRCGDQEFLWLLLALIAIAVWVTNVWVLDSTAVMTATGTVPH